MTSIALKPLVDLLGEHCRQALDGAAGLAVTNTHFSIEVEHWLLKLAERPDGDMAAICRHYGAEPATLAAGLTRAIGRLKRGNTRAPGLAPDLVNLLKGAWLVASVEYGARKVRSGHVLAALLADQEMANALGSVLGPLSEVPAETFRRDLPAVTAASKEAPAAAGEATPGGGAAATPADAGALAQYTMNLTQRARDGKLDAVHGRDAEIRQLADILSRRRQNNPILTGEPGVGKTAVVEGLAVRIAAGDVPPNLLGVELLGLDLALLQAGAGVRGEFENRLRQVLDAVRASPKPIIMFIDEAHTLIGAGGQAGQGDAANLLKPALARGEFRTIAATTWAEYKKYFERDAALARRFQVVKVEEPDDALAAAMLRGVAPLLERHHGVRILAEAVEAAVTLSRRYIPARQLPDKGVSLLDTACARVAMAMRAVPAALEDCRRQVELLDQEAATLRREAASGTDHGDRLTRLATERDALAAEAGALSARWEGERALVEEIQGLRDEAEALPAGEAAPVLARLTKARSRLAAMQGEHPLVAPDVDAHAVADVVAAWTGIPVGRMRGDQLRTVLALRERMGERIVGQPHALEAVAQAMVTARAKLTDPRKPLGVFLMVGTSGVGKTETALALADILYGGEQNLTVINMSEFKEEHKVSMLLGSPPGYVGYGEGGVLTEAVRRRPYSVILLDEMEKAHPGVQDVFYQVFDKGIARDGEGREIDFRNTVIIMTSNAGTDLLHKLAADPETMPDAAVLADLLRPELLSWFKPAFLGRCTLVPYLPLPQEVLRQIVGLQLRRIADRFRAGYGAELTFDPRLVDHVAARATQSESGARHVQAILSNTLLPELSARLLERVTGGAPIGPVTVGMGEDGGLTYGF